MEGRPVLMIVDLVVDRFVEGSPKRISREAPVLILRYEGEGIVPGGGGNAVANVAALGGGLVPVGFVGDDENGEALLSDLEGRGVPVDGIRRRSSYRTPTKTRILAGGRHSIKQQVVRYDVEDAVALDEADRRDLEERLRDLAEGVEVAILSDYGYGGAIPDLVAPCRRALGDRGTILCDSRHRLGEFRGLDGATPNEEEAEALVGETLGDDDERLLRAGRRMLSNLGARFLLVTRGSSGMALFLEEGWIRIPIHGSDEVADVTGAGDTVIGAFGLTIAAGGSPLEAALLANYAGGRVVMKRGTATLSPDELTESVRTDPRPLEEARWERY